jgi:hypothetical protein
MRVDSPFCFAEKGAVLNVKSRTKEIVLLIGLFCVVFGAKVLAISHYGSIGIGLRLVSDPQGGR